MKHVYIVFEYGKIFAVYEREYDARMCQSVDFNRRHIKEFEVL